MDTHPILEPLNALLHLTPEQNQELRDAGYVPGDVYTGVHRLIDQLNRQALMRMSILSMNNDQRSALQSVAHALHLDSGPDYRAGCQDAFMKLSGLENFDQKDLSIALSILKPFNLA